MKNYYVVSLVKNGLLGGGIVADTEAITYRTGKMTVPSEYRNLVMKYEEISEVISEKFLFLPAVTVKMKNGNENKFVVFFHRNSLVESIRDRGVQV